MDAVFDLIEAQRMAGRRFVLAGQLQSGSWSAPAAPKILKIPENTQVIVKGQVGGGLKTRVVANDEVLADAVKYKDTRRLSFWLRTRSCRLQSRSPWAFGEVEGGEKRCHALCV